MPANPKAETNQLPTATTFAEQELQLVRIVLLARGWTLTDSKRDVEGITIIARRRFPLDQETS